LAEGHLDAAKRLAEQLLQHDLIFRHLFKRMETATSEQVELIIWV